MNDCVATLHHNPQLCGVSKFSYALAERMGIPCVTIADAVNFSCPLLSVKGQEMPTFAGLPDFHQYDLFLHDHAVKWGLLMKARTVYAGNPVIAEYFRKLRPDIITAWCPSTLNGNPHRASLNVLTFGMAHKLQIEKYRKLKTLLDASGQDYTLSVSTAVHEGSPWDAVATVGDQLREMFGENTRLLGFLADDALVRELRAADVVALFFDPAVRANNTTYWAARDEGCSIVTNYDDQSPEGPSEYGRYDIDALTEFPRVLCDSMPHTYTWDALLQTMGVSVNV